MMASVEPYVPLGGGSLPYLIGGLFIGLCLIRVLRRLVLPFLFHVASWGAITVFVFLRTGMGARTVSIKSILIGAVFLYFIGNMVGHNYHDFYRDRNATIWGAGIHFGYLVAFILMAGFRRFQAWQKKDLVQPDSYGLPSRPLKRLWNYVDLDGKWGVFKRVCAEPLLVISVGLLLAFGLQNWFGWYLVITGCLLFYWYLCGYLLFTGVEVFGPPTPPE